MTILNTGVYTKKTLLETDIGTNGKLPTKRQDCIIVNPHGFGIPSYRVSVDNPEEPISRRLYKIEVI